MNNETNSNDLFIRCLKFELIIEQLEDDYCAIECKDNHVKPCCVCGIGSAKKKLQKTIERLIKEDIELNI
jgi:hypothetical protein